MRAGPEGGWGVMGCFPERCQSERSRRRTHGGDFTLVIHESDVGLPQTIIFLLRTSGGDIKII